VSLVQGDHDIGGLDIPMNDAFGVGVLDRPADLQEQQQPLFSAEAILIAVFRDGNPRNQFHDKVGPAGLGGSGIEYLGDTGPEAVLFRRRLCHIRLLRGGATAA
jgi:hypothetical protein